MSEADAIGPDGTVRLRCYLPLANSLWFFAGYQGRQGCGHVAPISVRAAIQIMGSGEETARCRGGGGQSCPVASSLPPFRSI